MKPRCSNPTAPLSDFTEGPWNGCQYNDQCQYIKKYCFAMLFPIGYIFLRVGFSNMNEDNSQGHHADMLNREKSVHGSLHDFCHSKVLKKIQTILPRKPLIKSYQQHDVTGDHQKQSSSPVSGGKWFVPPSKAFENG